MSASLKSLQDMVAGFRLRNPFEPTRWEMSTATFNYLKWELGNLTTVTTADIEKTLLGYPIHIDDGLPPGLKILR